MSLHLIIVCNSITEPIPSGARLPAVHSAPSVVVRDSSYGCFIRSRTGLVDVLA